MWGNTEHRNVFDERLKTIIYTVSGGTKCAEIYHGFEEQGGTSGMHIA